MVEFEANAHINVTKSCPQNNDPALIIKDAINTWLSLL